MVVSVFKIFNNEPGGLLPAGERKQDQKFMGFVHVERLVKAIITV